MRRRFLNLFLKKQPKTRFGYPLAGPFHIALYLRAALARLLHQKISVVILDMKIRIKGNSIRYRLSQSEVKLFSETGYVVESTVFGTNLAHRFQYELRMKSGIRGLEASLEGSTICLFLPEADAIGWSSSDLVGFEGHYEAAPGISLHLLLEKDFVCLDNTAEDQSDNYPNPNKTC